jgi:hypothetical protein
MTEGTRVIFASIAGLLPWGIAAIVTNWYNELQSNGIHTLGVRHALLLLVMQFVLGIVTYFVLDNGHMRAR